MTSFAEFVELFGLPMKTGSSPSEDGISILNRDYQFPDADVVITSSDGLQFRVHSHRLISASPVFHHLLAGHDNVRPKELILANEDIERSDTVSLFLDIVHGKPFAIDDDQDALEILPPLIQFIQKYRSPLALHVVHRALGVQELGTDLPSDELFELGYLLKDDGLIDRAIRQCGDCIWEDSTTEDPTLPQTVNDPISGATVLDLSAMDWDKFQKIPKEYMFSLLRASRLNPGMAADGDWDAVAVEFRRVMSEMRTMKHV